MRKFSGLLWKRGKVMRKILWRTLVPFIIGMTVFGALILFNQLNQLAVAAASNFKYGYYLAWGFFAMVAVFTFYPVFSLFFLPKALKRPHINSTPEEKREFYYNYKNRIIKECSQKNSSLKRNVDIDKLEILKNSDSIHGIKESLGEIERDIDKEVDKMIKKYAGAIFTSTAISQNGTLDIVFVLKIELEMIWKIAHYYNQKPSIKELLNLYITVFGNVLAAAGVSEVSIQEIVQSLLSKALNGMPVISKITAHIADSIFDGTCNALLSLRLGLITKDYCKYSSEFDERESRKRSRKKALELINDIKYKDTIQKILRKEKESV